MRNTDVADVEQLLPLVQSIPYPKAEPFKLWLAQIGSERLDEIEDPELTIDRALEQYLRLGYSQNWINQRLKSIEVRKELTDEWKQRGVKEGVQFATPTGIIIQAWSGKTTKEYKNFKELKKENLRDNMTNTELILNYSKMKNHAPFSIVICPLIKVPQTPRISDNLTSDFRVYALGHHQKFNIGTNFRVCRELNRMNEELLVNLGQSRSEEQLRQLMESLPSP